MTNLGAGFPVGNLEFTGPQPPCSSGPPSERDRYAELCCVCLQFVNEKGCFFLVASFFLVFCSRQLMPPPLLPVNGVRPKMEERRAPQGPMGKDIVLWIAKIPAQTCSS